MEREKHPEKFKNAANIITLVRIAASLALLLISPLTAWFFVVYTLCGVSDVADGAAARKFGCASRLGAKLDSIADAVFLLSSVLALLPFLQALCPLWSWITAGGVLIVRLCAWVVSALKFRRFAAYHTFLNKAAGALLFALPYLMRLPHFTAALAVVCAVAALSAIEELICSVAAKEFEPDAKGLASFLKR